MVEDVDAVLRVKVTKGGYAVVEDVLRVDERRCGVMEESFCCCVSVIYES